MLAHWREIYAGSLEGDIQYADSLERICAGSLEGDICCFIGVDMCWLIGWRYAGSLERICAGSLERIFAGSLDRICAGSLVGDMLAHWW